MNSVSEIDPQKHFPVAENACDLLVTVLSAVYLSTCVFKFLPGFIIWPLGTKRLKMRSTKA